MKKNSVKLFLVVCATLLKVYGGNEPVMLSCIEASKLPPQQCMVSASKTLKSNLSSLIKSLGSHLSEEQVMFVMKQFLQMCDTHFLEKYTPKQWQSFCANVRSHNNTNNLLRQLIAIQLTNQQ